MKNSVVHGNFGGGNLKGWVSNAGVIEFKHPISQFPSLSLDYSGVLRGDSGNGISEEKGAPGNVAVLSQRGEVEISTHLYLV